MPDLAPLEALGRAFAPYLLALAVFLLVGPRLTAMVRRHSTDPAPSGRFVVGVLAPSLAIAAWCAASSARLLPTLALACFGAALAMIDVREHRLPNRIVLGFVLVAVPASAASLLLEGQPERFAWALGLGAAATILGGLMALIVPSAIGMGDIKILGATIVVLLTYGWTVLLLGLVAAVFAAGIVSLVVIVRAAGGAANPAERIESKTSRVPAAIPMAPFLFAALPLGVVLERMLLA